MSRIFGWDAIVEALSDGRPDAAKSIFEDVISSERYDAYEDGREAGRAGASDPITCELEEAKVLLLRSERAEAMIHLERALGGEFIGRLVQP